MEYTNLSHTSATNYYQSIQQQEFEAHLCASKDTLAEITELCQYFSKYLTQVLDNISETELNNDNHLKHTADFISEVKQGISSVDLTRTKSLLLSIYGDDYKEEYFENALMKVLDELELCHDYTFINNSPIWIDQLSDFCLMQTSLLCKDGIWDTTKALRFVCYKMPSILQKEYSVSDTVVEQALSEFEFLPKDILNASRMLHDMANVESLFQDYDPTSVSIEQIEKYVELAGYVELPHHLYYLAEQAKKLDRWDLWTTLWDKLQHPVLQYSLLWSCKPLSLIDGKLRAALLQCQHSRLSVCLYFHHWLKCWRKGFENLQTYTEPNGWLADRLSEHGIDRQANTERVSQEKTFPNECMELFAYMEKVVSVSDIVNMVSDIRSLADVAESTTQKVYEFTRTTLIDVMCNRYQSTKFDIGSQPLAQLLILSQMATAFDTPDSNYLKSLWDAVEARIYADKFYWNGTITASQQHNMFLVAQLFMSAHPFQQNAIDEYVERHRVRYEGWGVMDISRRSDQCRSECFMLCVFLMSLLSDGYYPDESTKNQHLHSIIKHAILQDKSCHDTVLCSAYQRAVLLLAKCIASQKLLSQNNDVDRLLIEQIDNFVDLSELFINSSSVLSEENKQLYKDRYDVEWKNEKQFLQSHSHRRNLAAIDRGVKILIK